jgi:hypothetical protein
MKKILELIKRFWDWLKKLTTKKEFVFTFPLAVFAVLAFILHSFLMVVVIIIWIITIIHNINAEE